MRFLFVWGPALALMALIFAASSSPHLGSVPGLISDKILHLGAYAVLGLLMLRALAEGRLARVTPRRAIVAVGLSVLYGISDEVHQAFVPGRTPEFMDVVADAVGAAGGAAALVLLRTVRGPRGAAHRDRQRRA